MYRLYSGLYELPVVERAYFGQIVWCLKHYVLICPGSATLIVCLRYEDGAAWVSWRPRWKIARHLGTSPKLGLDFAVLPVVDSYRLAAVRVIVDIRSPLAAGRRPQATTQRAKLIGFS